MTAPVDLKPEKLAYRIKEAAESVGLSQSYLRGEIDADRLAYRRAGTAITIPRDDLIDWLMNLPQK